MQNKRKKAIFAPITPTTVTTTVNKSAKIHAATTFFTHLPTSHGTATPSKFRRWPVPFGGFGLGVVFAAQNL